MTRITQATAPEETSLDEPEAPVSTARPTTLVVVELPRVAPSNDAGLDALRRALSPGDRELIDLLAERFAAAWLRLHR